MRLITLSALLVGCSLFTSCEDYPPPKIPVCAWDGEVVFCKDQKTDETFERFINMGDRVATPEEYKEMVDYVNGLREKLIKCQ